MTLEEKIRTLRAEDFEVYKESDGSYYATRNRTKYTIDEAIALVAAEGGYYTPAGSLDVNSYIDSVIGDYLHKVDDLVTQPEAEAGSIITARSYSPQRVSQAIAALAKALAYLRLGTDTVDGYLRVTGKAYVDIEAVTFANPLICDCSKSNNHNCTITGDTAVQLSNLSAGMSGMIALLNDGAGAHTVTFTTGFDKQGNGSDTYDATASKYNWISWYYNGVVTVYSITNEA